MLLAQLNEVHREAEQLCSSKPASDEKRKHRVIPFSAQRIHTSSAHQPFPLLGSEPVANPHAQPAHFHTTNADGQFRTQKAGIDCFVGKSPDPRETRINR
jgi:hypothetical protein